MSSGGRTSIKFESFIGFDGTWALFLRFEALEAIFVAEILSCKYLILLIYSSQGSFGNKDVFGRVIIS